MAKDSKFLKILTPCGEKFDAMTPIAEGCRHCDVCSSQVFDTSKISYRKFLKLISKSDKKACFSFKTTDHGYIKFAPSVSTCAYNLCCTLFFYLCKAQHLYAQERKESSLSTAEDCESATMGIVNTGTLLILNLIEGRYGLLIILSLGLSGILTTVWALIRKKSLLLALGVALVVLGAILFVTRRLVSTFFETTMGIMSN